MKTAFEIRTEDIASITKILGKDKIGAHKSTNVVRSAAHRIIMNTDPDSPAEMRERIKDSIRGLYAAKEYCGLEISDVITCWGMAFPHKVGEILECVTDSDDPLQFKDDPHAEGYVLGLFQAANLVKVSDVDHFQHTDNMIYHFLYQAIRQRYWNRPEILLHSYVSGALSNALGVYLQGCLNPERIPLRRRHNCIGGIIRAFEFPKPKNEIEIPDINLHWSLGNELISKFFLASSLFEKHRMVSLGITTLLVD